VVAQVKGFVYGALRMSVSITLKRPAYERLKKLKEPGESFSDVVIRHLPQPCDTCAEVEDYLTKNGVPAADPVLRQKMIQGRSRRSKR
jgi:hypothetical protein